MRLLALDDDSLFLNIYSKHAKEYGFNIDATKSPHDALGYFFGTPSVYTGFILDLFLPGEELNGLMVAREIRKVRPKANIWFVTAMDARRAQPALYAELREAGEVIQKPFLTTDIDRMFQSFIPSGIE